MDFQKAHDLLGIELECIYRNIDRCDRNCAECDLVQKDEDLIAAYKVARYALRYMIKEAEYDEYIKFMEERGFE